MTDNGGAAAQPQEPQDSGKLWAKSTGGGAWPAVHDLETDRLTVGSGEQARSIAVLRRGGAAPGLFWLGGFRSAMTGTKATAVDGFAAARDLACTRFDYSGHGASGGAAADGTISRWLEEATAVLDRCTNGAQIVVGSSMGGWLALLLAEALRGSDRILGLVLIAPAVDMTRRLMWDTWDEAARSEFRSTGVYRQPSDHSDEPYEITRALIEDGDRHLIGDRLIDAGCPVHVLQGLADTEVPWRATVDLVSHLASDDVVLTLVKDGDHRLSRNQDIERLNAAIAGMIAETAR
jgi:alpha-beta hydrolase superfamily lysophospholipase